jgi:hypothetical protein
MRVAAYKKPAEQSLQDVANLAANTYYYPAEAGLEPENFKDFSITGKLVCGADNTVTVTIEGTNDEDATPANRDWIQCYGYSTYANAVINSVANPASTTTPVGWDFDGWNYRYFRVKVVTANPGPAALSNTVILKLRRKFL